MKTFLTKILAMCSLVLLITAGCKKDGLLVTSNGGTAGTLSSSATTIVLLKSKFTDTTKVIKFSFTQANYGYNAAVTNTLQIDKTSDNWAHPTSVTLSAKVFTQGYNTADFNNLILKLGIAGGTTTTVQVRIVQSISATVAPIYSNVVSLTVTPFNLTSWIYAVGAFQGWNAASPDSLISATGNGVYVGIINFTAGNNQFLILPAKNFNNKYATTQSSTPTSTVAYNANNNLIAPAAAGQYVVTFDSNAGTITFGLANLYSAIGSTTPGGNFSADVDFTKFVNDGVTGWTGTFAFTYGTFPGSFKVRQNHDWTYSWGIPKSGSEGFGVANTLNDSSNDNIPVATSGNYTVTFYIAPSVQGASPGSSAPPSVTATYTIK